MRNNNMMIDRRQWLGGCAVGAMLCSGAGAHAAARAVRGRGLSGFDGQRRADQGNGRFLNPILAGDWPDPTILKDGDDYYMTHSSFDASPGLLIWHSRDLVNWLPIVNALPA
ncbi:MAG: family 43 glycosylhydrolase, partial [Sphingopyxis sp.]